MLLPGEPYVDGFASSCRLAPNGFIYRRIGPVRLLLLLRLLPLRTTVEAPLSAARQAPLSAARIPIAGALDRAALLDIRDVDGRTALHKAAERGYPSAVERLLEHSALLDSVDLDNKTAMDLARAAGHEAVVAMLSERGSVAESLATMAESGARRGPQKSARDDSDAVAGFRDIEADAVSKHYEADAAEPSTADLTIVESDRSETAAADVVRDSNLSMNVGAKNIEVAASVVRELGRSEAADSPLAIAADSLAETTAEETEQVEDQQFEFVLPYSPSWKQEFNRLVRENKKAAGITEKSRKDWFTITDARGLGVLVGVDYAAEQFPLHVRYGAQVQSPTGVARGEL